MKFTSKYTFVFIIILSLSYISNAQIWNIRIGTGISSYAGDLTPGPISFENSHPAIRAGLGAELLPRLAVEFSFLGGKVSGYDNDKTIDPSRITNFKSTIYSYELLMKYRVKKMDIHNSKLGVSILLGGGMFVFEPRDNISETSVILSELMRENVFYGENAPTALLGLEFSYPITRKLILSFQSVYHPTFTDYLDDVSLRKNPNNNDSFLDNTISFIYRFGKEEEFLKLIDPMSCPAFFR